MIDREKLRRDIRACRKRIEPDEVEKRSRCICERLAGIERLQAARIIMAYAPMPGEADPSFYWFERWQEGATVLLPRVEGDELVPVAFTGWERTATGPFGIREPVGGPYPVEKIEAVIVPGVAFDRHGYRLGHGKGYYDRFLPRLSPSALRCGVGFECQLVETVDPGPHDARLDLLVTDRRVEWYI